MAKKTDKAYRLGSSKKKKKKFKKTGRKAPSDEGKLKGAKLARRGETSLKAKAKKSFSADQMLKRII